MSYKLQPNGYVVRLVDGAWIPPDENNTDWRDYQAWLLAGNIPEPADPSEARRSIEKALVMSRLTDAQLDAALSLMTNRQKERWRMPGHPDIFVDDPELLGLLAAIGADPSIVLASG